MSYQPHRGAMSCGAQIVVVGAICLFKPWFFDGGIVYWGSVQDTESAAIAEAEILRSRYI